MFDDVSGRYDVLNRLLSLGQDGAWREAMWREVPEPARRVLDLCTGSGVSLPGLRRTGRVVLGMDVSLAMLRAARDQLDDAGWAPRLACADAFRLPLRDGAVDAITVAFGVRNLRPRASALAEMARVLGPDGVVVVLEACAPAPGPLAPALALWIRHAIPLLGRLSPDPSAYRYLSESIFEFGPGPAFEADLVSAGFVVERRTAFLFGATRLWAARRRTGVGRNSTEPGESLRSARGRASETAHGASGDRAMAGEASSWSLAQAVLSTALTLALAWALVVWLKLRDDIPLNGFPQPLVWGLIGLGLVVFAVRSVVLWLHVATGGARRRTWK